MTARYSCISDLPDDEVDDGVWSDGPLIDNFGQTLAIVSLPAGRGEEVLPFIIRNGVMKKEPRKGLRINYAGRAINPCCTWS